MFLTIKKIPKVSWSSEKPLNLRPKLTTFLFLSFGLSLFGIGEGLLLVSYMGASPWSVFAQGISLHVDYSIGLITFFTSLIVILLWVFLSQKPGIGTILNAIIIAAMIDICLNFFQTPDTFAAKILLAFFSVFLVGIGSGFYLIANLGPGPRDGLMTGIQRKTKRPFALIRTLIELGAVAFGWYLGGIVGIGTIIYALGIGPLVSFGMFFVGRYFK